MLLSRVSMRPGVRFLLENGRTLGTITICLAGFGGIALAATGTRVCVASSRRLRVAALATATLAFLAVQPLPAGADPTFKAYGLTDVPNPRYFYVRRTEEQCARFLGDAPIRIGITAEKTKVRVNGVAGPRIARLEYQSAPGGAARTIPLLKVYPGWRLFSFRSANLSHGRLVAYGADGQPIATCDDELKPGRPGRPDRETPRSEIPAQPVLKQLGNSLDVLSCLI